jgi:hypothetical protein
VRCIAALLTVLCSLVVTGLTEVSAQESTPTANPALTGYPELNVTITDQALEVDKTEVPAGYVLLNVTNSSASANSAGVLGPGPGKTMSDLQQAASTPTSDEALPPFLYDAVVLGGPGDVEPGETAHVLLNIPAGDWAVFPEENQAPTMIISAEGAESNTTAPIADVTLEMGDFYFSGLTDGVPAGQGIWAVTNTGKQPHMLVLANVPDGTTEQHVIDTFTTEMTGTPVAGAMDPNAAQFLSTGVILLSSGESMYVPTDLQDGTYMALCFVTDPATGQPHIMEGMVSVFQVGGATATPAS